MPDRASPISIGRDMSLSAVLSALETHDDKALVIEYGGQQAQPGYHITEVKTGSFMTLDCGANPDAWQETILQVEDVPPEAGETFMSVGKFRSILGQVDRKIRLNLDARLTFEIGPPDVPMRIFDVASVAIEEDRAVLHFGARPAICKPRHRSQHEQAPACCGPSSKPSCG